MTKLLKLLLSEPNLTHLNIHCTRIELFLLSNDDSKKRKMTNTYKEFSGPKASRTPKGTTIFKTNQMKSKFYEKVGKIGLIKILKTIAWAL